MDGWLGMNCAMKTMMNRGPVEIMNKGPLGPDLISGDRFQRNNCQGQLAVRPSGRPSPPQHHPHYLMCTDLDARSFVPLAIIITAALSSAAVTAD